jgi:hypothetical protein
MKQRLWFKLWVLTSSPSLKKLLENVYRVSIIVNRVIDNVTLDFI